MSDSRAEDLCGNLDQGRHTKNKFLVVGPPRGRRVKAPRPLSQKKKLYFINDMENIDEKNMNH